MEQPLWQSVWLQLLSKVSSQQSYAAMVQNHDLCCITQVFTSYSNDFLHKKKYKPELNTYISRKTDLLIFWSTTIKDSKFLGNHFP